jgi:Domain of unknown function (DUF4136)
MRSIMLAVALAVAACGVLPPTPPTVTVKAERDPSADLARYRSWAWVASRAEARPWNPDNPGSRLDGLIRNGVSRELAARGIQPAGPSGPDVLIDYDVVIREKSTDTFSGYFSYRRSGGSGDMGDAFMGYDEGTLVIVAIDARTRRMVWRGSASAVLNGDRIKDAVVDDAIHRIFEKFS